MNKWTKHFLRIAAEAGSMSKDPSTQVGAVLVVDRRVVGTGFNGFPGPIRDSRSRLEDRDTKLKLIVHAEMNALLDAGREARGSTLYLHGFQASPCLNCTKHLIQAGVRAIVAYGPPLPERWKEETQMAAAILAEADVDLMVDSPESDGYDLTSEL
jgi:dCMP deaminase